MSRTKKCQKRIGVLAVQGAFAEHIQMLKRCSAEGVEIREPDDLKEELHGLILPGGESTAQIKLLHDLGLFAELDRRLRDGLPVYGTCAGLLLLAKDIDNDRLDNFGLMNLVAVRNAYGRQLGSFMAAETFAGKTIPMPFIRAPYIERIGDGVEVLSVVDGKITAARQQHMLVTAFHPEVTEDTTVHRYFLNMIAE